MQNSGNRDYELALHFPHADINSSAELSEAEWFALQQPELDSTAQENFEPEDWLEWASMFG